MDDIVRTYNLTKHLDGILAVDNVSIAICKNSITSLVGANGAGKTTLFNLITSFSRPDSGEIIFNGNRISGRDKVWLAEKGMARLWQDIRLFHNMSVLENLLVSYKQNIGEKFINNFLRMRSVKISETIAEKKAMEVLEFIGLLSHKNYLANTLSYGQQKRVAIGRLLMNDAELLLLDEPFSGLDNNNNEKISRLLKTLIDEGKTILMIEHNIEKALTLSDRIYEMDAGKIIFAGTPNNYCDYIAQINKNSLYIHE